MEEHSGWTGLVSTSWSLKNSNQREAEKQAHNRANSYAANNADLRFNGESKVLYWADVSSEIAFVVPTEWNMHCETDGSCLSLCSSHSSGDSLQSAASAGNVWTRASDANAENAKTQKSRNLSLELDTKGAGAKEPVPPTRRKTNAMKPSLQAQPPAKIFLVWLESFEDHLNFPIGNAHTSNLM